MLRALTALFLFAAGAAQAAPCTAPPPVAAWLAAHPAWRLLRVSDLVADDRMSWNSWHRGLCPGMAAARFDAGVVRSYALALVRRRGDKDFEQVVVLKAPDFTPVTLVVPFEGTGIVIWRTGPTTITDVLGSGRTVRIRHDSVMWEKMEAASQLFYFVRGRPRMIQAGD